MKAFSIVLCFIGIFVTALGVIPYYEDERGIAVAAFVFGVLIGLFGVMLFIADFIMRLFRRTASLMVRFRCWCLRLEVNGELGTPVDELRGVEDTVMEPLPGSWTD